MCQCVCLSLMQAAPEPPVSTWAHCVYFWVSQRLAGAEEGGRSALTRLVVCCSHPEVLLAVSPEQVTRGMECVC